MMRLTFLAAAATVLAGCASSSMTTKPYNQSMLPTAVQVPAGHKVAMATQVAVAPAAATRPWKVSGTLCGRCPTPGQFREESTSQQSPRLL